MWTTPTTPKPRSNFAMDETAQKSVVAQLEESVKAGIAAIEQEREREIITRRFGLFDRKETLEQIGELLGITRERVRQLEKAILIRLKMAHEEGKLDGIHDMERQIVRHLSENGRVGRVQDVTKGMLGNDATVRHNAHVAFISELSPQISVLGENDTYHHAIGIAEHGDAKQMKQHVDHIVKTIKTHGEPLHLEQLHAMLDLFEHPRHVDALASISKKLATLNKHWGLNKWPTVNPKNIRDKIYVILSDNGEPMHFSDIAKAIKNSDFKRKDVTTQAIHNELIKDKRFVLIGRGIYALDNWGFRKGTVSDVIADVLTKAGEPLHRDEIVRRVLKTRKVKETTVLLNLQSKPQFKRVAKATYTYDPEAK